MVQAVQQFFKQSGYQEAGSSTYVKVFPDELAVVQVINGNTIAMASADRILSGRQALIDNFISRQQVTIPIRILTVVILEGGVTEYFRELAKEIPGLWFISKSERRLYVYENQSTKYFGLYEPLAEYVSNINLVQKRKETVAYALSNLQIVTLVLVITNVLVYVYTALHGNIYDAHYMFSKGAITWDSVFQKHEYYRLLTCMFLHFGIGHLSSNMISLMCLGTMLEKRIGHFRYFILYILSGLAAGLLSISVQYYKYIYGISEYYAVSAGASGAIFGVIGGLIAVVICQSRWQKRRPGFAAVSLRGVVIMTCCSLFEGFTITGVDNSAHVGGLIFGLIFAFLLAIKP